jgi:hypothetical protein
MLQAAMAREAAKAASGNTADLRGRERVMADFLVVNMGTKGSHEGFIMSGVHNPRALPSS